MKPIFLSASSGRSAFMVSYVVAKLARLAQLRELVEASRYEALRLERAQALLDTLA